MATIEERDIETFIKLVEKSEYKEISISTTKIYPLPRMLFLHLDGVGFLYSIPLLYSIQPYRVKKKYEELTEDEIDIIVESLKKNGYEFRNNNYVYPY